MNVSERDIFNFVFYPDYLSDEKFSFLKTSKIFDEEVDFFISLKKSLDENLTAEIKNKIAERIPIYVPSQTYSLYPVRELQRKKKNNIQVLAADSPKEKPEVTVKTFVDETNHYLIRLLNFKDSAKIYTFSTTEQSLKNFKVVIHPASAVFNQADNSTPIEVNHPIEAEKIELKFD
jgi:hypothetical protein